MGKEFSAFTGIVRNVAQRGDGLLLRDGLDRLSRFKRPKHYL